MRLAARDREDRHQRQHKNDFLHATKVNEIASRASLAHTNRWIEQMTETPKSLKGELILDQGKLHGSFFHRAVILICEHNEEGAFGLVLNRSTANKVGDALVAKLPQTFKEETLYLGGPVQPQALSFLHHDVYLPEANVMPNLSLGHSLDALMDLGDSFSSTRKIRMFAGYAGWSPGQLEDEMKRKAWLTHPASLELVFETDPAKLWQNILRTKGGKYILLAQMPEDLSMN